MTEIDWREQYEELERTLGYIFAGFQHSLESGLTAPHSTDVELDSVRISLSDTVADVVAVHSGSPAAFAFYLYRNDERVAVVPYSPKNSALFSIDGSGRYRIRAFAKPLHDNAATPVECVERFEVK